MDRSNYSLDSSFLQELDIFESRYSMPFTNAKGFLNPSGQNNCFLNCAVQVLWHLDAFRRSFRSLSGHACMGQACIFCALKVIFTQYQFSDGDVIPPDALRSALAYSFADQQRFQLGVMDDAAECFENILLRIHKHLCYNEPENACQVPYCISHQKFALSIIEQCVCRCHATTEPLLFTQIVHYVSTSALLEMTASCGNQYRKLQFGKVIRRARCSGDVKKCPMPNCGRTVDARWTLTSTPEVISIGFNWDTDQSSDRNIRGVVNAISQELCPRDLFYSVVDEDWSARTTMRLVGLVCYYGHHYSTFIFHSKMKTWLLFDDASVKEIGPDWNLIADRCYRGRYQPLLLLYADSNNYTPLDTTLASTVTFLLPLDLECRKINVSYSDRDLESGILEEETSALKQTTFDDVKDASRFDDTCLASGTVSKQNSSNSLSDSIAIDETRNLIGCSLSGSNESSSGAFDSSHSSINLNSTDLIRVKSEPMALMENGLNSQEVEEVSHVSRRVQKRDRDLGFDNRRRQAIYSTDKLSYDGSSSCVPENMVTHCLSVETEKQHVAEKGESLCVDKKTLKQHLARKGEKQIAEEIVEKQCILEKLASQCLAERMANKSKSSRNRKISSSSVADPCIAASSEVRQADETVSLRVSKQTDSAPMTDQNSSSKMSNNERKNCYNAQKYSSDEISSAAVKALNQWKATRKAVATAHSQITDKKTKADVDRYSKKQDTSSANGKNRFDAIYRKAEIAASKPGFLSTPIPRKTKIMSTSRDVEKVVDHDAWAKDFDPSGDVVHLKFKGKTLEGVVFRPESFSASLEKSDAGSSQFAANDPPKDKFKRAEKSDGVDAVLQSEKSWNQTGIQCEESCDEPVARNREQYETVAQSKQGSDEMVIQSKVNCVETDVRSTKSFEGKVKNDSDAAVTQFRFSALRVNPDLTANKCAASEAVSNCKTIFHETVVPSKNNCDEKSTGTMDCGGDVVPQSRTVCIEQMNNRRPQTVCEPDPLSNLQIVVPTKTDARKTVRFRTEVSNSEAASKVLPGYMPSKSSRKSILRRTCSVDTIDPCIKTQRSLNADRPTIDDYRIYKKEVISGSVDEKLKTFLKARRDNLNAEIDGPALAFPSNHEKKSVANSGCDKNFKNINNQPQNLHGMVATEDKKADNDRLLDCVRPCSENEKSAEISAASVHSHHLEETNLKNNLDSKKTIQSTTRQNTDWLTSVVTNKMEMAEKWLTCGNYASALHYGYQAIKALNLVSETYATVTDLLPVIADIKARTIEWHRSLISRCGKINVKSHIAEIEASLKSKRPAPPSYSEVVGNEKYVVVRDRIPPLLHPVMDISPGYLPQTFLQRQRSLSSKAAPACRPLLGMHMGSDNSAPAFKSRTKKFETKERKNEDETINELINRTMEKNDNQKLGEPERRGGTGSAAGYKMEPKKYEVSRIADLNSRESEKFSRLTTTCTSDENILRSQETLPRGQDTLPRGQETLPRGQETSQRGQETLSKSQETLPRGQEILQKSKEALPCSDNFVPIHGSSPRHNDVGSLIDRFDNLAKNSQNSRGGLVQDSTDCPRKRYPLDPSSRSKNEPENSPTLIGARLDTRGQQPGTNFKGEPEYRDRVTSIHRWLDDIDQHTGVMIDRRLGNLDRQQEALYARMIDQLNPYS